MCRSLSIASRKRSIWLIGTPSVAVSAGPTVSSKTRTNTEMDVWRESKYQVLRLQCEKSVFTNI